MNDTFTWTEGMSVGVRELDLQHRHLFGMLNELIAAIDGSPDKSDHRLLLLMSGIMNYNLYHLQSEEDLMEEFDCTSAAHVEAHAFYRKTISDRMYEVQRLIKKDVGEGHKLLRELALFAGHWHVEHILTADKKYTGCFHEHGVY